VSYFDRTHRTKGENKTIGIVLCSEQNAAMVKIMLPADNEQIIEATYLKYLPGEAELQAELGARARGGRACAAADGSVRDGDWRGMTELGRYLANEPERDRRSTSCACACSTSSASRSMAPPITRRPQRGDRSG
jgi:hypothetical protein